MPCNLPTCRKHSTHSLAHACPPPSPPTHAEGLKTGAYRMSACACSQNHAPGKVGLKTDPLDRSPKHASSLLPKSLCPSRTTRRGPSPPATCTCASGSSPTAALCKAAGGCCTTWSATWCVQLQRGMHRGRVAGAPRRHLCLCGCTSTNSRNDQGFGGSCPPCLCCRAQAGAEA